MWDGMLSFLDDGKLAPWARNRNLARLAKQCLPLIGPADDD